MTNQNSAALFSKFRGGFGAGGGLTGAMGGLGGLAASGAAATAATSAFGRGFRYQHWNGKNYY